MAASSDGRNPRPRAPCDPGSGCSLRVLGYGRRAGGRLSGDSIPVDGRRGTLNPPATIRHQRGCSGGCAGRIEASGEARNELAPGAPEEPGAAESPAAPDAPGVPGAPGAPGASPAFVIWISPSIAAP